MTRWNHTQSAKEIVRHVLFRTGLDWALTARRARRGVETGHLGGGSRASRFGDAYRLGAWVEEAGQSARSGRGSELHATAGLRAALPGLLAEIGCTHLVDVGCGDWTWMREVELPCAYTGLDIVAEVIAANKPLERPGVSFAVADAVVDPLPKADAVLCREVLFHLSLADGMALIANIHRSARWLVATNDPAIWFNSDIRSGDYRMINLQRPPFGFPPPVRWIDESGSRSGRVLGVWPISSLPVLDTRGRG